MIFGTGYSSLNHIREMPLDIIKIDKCFIEHLGEDDFSDAFVKMVTELANTIGVHVCVEGVETDRQYAIIKKMGIDYIQGYFFDKPMCIESSRRNISDEEGVEKKHMLLYNEADRRNTGLMIFLFSYSVWSIYRIG